MPFFFSLYIFHHSDDPGELAWVHLCDDVRAVHLHRRGRVHALVEPHHRHHQHERSHYQVGIDYLDSGYRTWGDYPGIQNFNLRSRVYSSWTLFHSIMQRWIQKFPDIRIYVSRIFVLVLHTSALLYQKLNLSKDSFHLYSNIWRIRIPLA